MLTLGQFLAGLAERESSTNPLYLNPNNGALGLFSVLPGRWDAWCKAYFGRTMPAPEWHDPAIQWQVVVWVQTKRRQLFRTKHPSDTVQQTYQRMACAWLGGMSVAHTSPSTWSQHLQDYVTSVGGRLRRLGYEGW